MIILVGPSASGKTEVGHMLKKLYGVTKAITHTTRQPRVGEENGVDYYFVSEDEFMVLKAKGSFVETTFYNGRYYGCSKAEISDGKCVIVDPNGLQAFLSLSDPSVVAFSLTATKETRERRMKERGDKEEDIKKRLDGDTKDFASERVASTDFEIATDEKTIMEITDDVYVKYLSSLAKRGIKPNLSAKK